jgi:antirestriction protein ArdC
MQRVEKQDIYTRITNEIVSHLERGVRPWVKPWNAEHAYVRNPNWPPQGNVIRCPP